MSDIAGKIKERFEAQVNQQENRLNQGYKEFHAYEPLVKNWPVRKKKIRRTRKVYKSRWKTKLRHINKRFYFISFRLQLIGIRRRRFCSFYHWRVWNTIWQIFFLGIFLILKWIVYVIKETILWIVQTIKDFLAWFKKEKRNILKWLFKIAIICLLGYVFFKLISLLGDYLSSLSVESKTIITR